MRITEGRSLDLFIIHSDINNQYTDLLVPGKSSLESYRGSSVRTRLSFFKTLDMRSISSRPLTYKIEVIVDNTWHCWSSPLWISFISIVDEQIPFAAYCVGICREINKIKFQIDNHRHQRKYHTASLFFPILSLVQVHEQMIL